MFLQKSPNCNELLLNIFLLFSHSSYSILFYSYSLFFFTCPSSIQSNSSWGFSFFFDWNFSISSLTLPNSFCSIVLLSLSLWALFLFCFSFFSQKKILLVTTTQKSKRVRILVKNNNWAKFSVACERLGAEKRKLKLFGKGGFRFVSNVRVSHRNHSKQNAQLCSLIHLSMKTFGIYFTRMQKAIWKLW